MTETSVDEMASVLLLEQTEKAFRAADELAAEVERDHPGSRRRAPELAGEYMKARRLMRRLRALLIAESGGRC